MLQDMSTKNPRTEKLPTKLAPYMPEAYLARKPPVQRKTANNASRELIFGTSSVCSYHSATAAAETTSTNKMSPTDGETRYVTNCSQYGV
ncbi:hypothetical protein B5X24_HaOG212837 [Helicoverpa armigera]|nr:hypothetical protein B5X24_HaOG212837 [Helicoverpa armigera]